MMAEKKRLTKEEFLAQLKALKEKKAELESQEAKYREGNLIEFFEPIEPYQTKIIEYIQAGKKTVTLQGANQIGKTTLGAAICGSFCLGIQPWDGKETIFGRRPVKGRILCSDWENHAAKVIVPELKKWFPIGQYGTPKKNNLGIEALWQFKSGSTLELLTNKQDTRDHEGWKGDFVWADEPPDRDKYVANKRGLIASNGLFLLTMTAVSQSWVLDEIVLNTEPTFASVTEIPIRSNPYLTEDGIRSFESSLREDEKIARIQGGWLNLSGLIWKEFRPDVHMIDSFKVPTDWPVIALVDWHINKPIAVSFYAFDQKGMVYVIDETWENGSAEEIGDEIIRRKRSNVWRLEEAFIDPLSKGDTAYVKNMGVEIKDTFTRLKERLWTDRIDLKVATKDKDSGIRNVEDMLKGVNGMPTLFFFRDLNKIHNEGHIWEIQRWNYDENEKPKDENDHFMENLYRMTLTGIRYTPVRRSTDSVRAETEFNPLLPNYGIRESETEFNVWR